MRVYQWVGPRGVLEGLLHPLLIPLGATAAMVRTLWASRALLYGRWGRYQGFHPHNVLNSFFYKSQWLNFERYGRTGLSPLVGLGDYSLSRWFHLSQWSSCLYANAGAAVTLLGALVWILSHLIWCDAASWAWVLAVAGVLFFSSTAMAMAFTRQNYNILGWMWVPLALYGTLNAQWGLAALAWVAASLASITAIVASVPLILAYAVMKGTPEPLLAMLPALAILSLHVLPLLYAGGGGNALLNMAKMLGLLHQGIRYKRTSMRLDVFNLYLICLYGAGVVLLWWGSGVAPILAWLALGLFALNQMVVRFADDQSVIMLFTSIFAASLLSAAPSWGGLAGLLLVANPLPGLLGLCSLERDRTLVWIPSLEPFDHSDLQRGIEEFLAPVASESRIYFAFEEPAGVYENIFDGHRLLLELPIFVASSRGIHLFPNWYAVAETNYLGAPNCWGRSVEDVLDNTRRWSALYAIVYQDAGAELDPKWARAGFKRVASFDWEDWRSMLGGYRLWSTASAPCWWLLETPQV